MNPARVKGDYNNIGVFQFMTDDSCSCSVSFGLLDQHVRWCGTGLAYWVSSRRPDWRALLVLCYVQVQKSSDHLLVLSVMFLGFALEEINAVFAQANRDLDLLFAKSKFGGGKIPDDFDLANGAISVVIFLLIDPFAFPWCRPTDSAPLRPSESAPP